MPGYQAIRPGDLIAIRSSDPRYDEVHVEITTIGDDGHTIFLAGAWGDHDLEVVIRRVGKPTLNFLEH